MRVLVFGDSNTQGFWDTEGGWAGRLRKHYDTLQIKDFSKDQPTIFNLGVSGDRTTEIIARLANEVEARRWVDEEFVLVFAIGVNDSYKKNGKFFSTPEEYGERLKEIVKIGQKYTRKILFVGITSCDEKLTRPVY